jgi:uncharacterized protein YjdB
VPTIRAPRALPTATIGGGVVLTPSALSVTPATVEIEEAATQALTAVVTDERGSVLTVQKAVGASVFTPIAVTYASDDTNVATVNASTGLITAVAEGDCVITATITGTSITDTVAVTVTAAP